MFMSVAPWSDTRILRLLDNLPYHCDVLMYSTVRNSALYLRQTVRYTPFLLPCLFHINNNIKDFLKLVHVCLQPEQILLVSPIRATCFGRADHPQEIKYMILICQKRLFSLLNSAVPHKKTGASHWFSSQMISNSMPPYVHSLSQLDKTCYYLPSSHAFTLTSGVTKLSPELYLNMDIYMTYIKYTWLHRYEFMVECVCVFVCVFVFTDDGSIISLCKRRILFHIESPSTKFPSPINGMFPFIYWQIQILSLVLTIYNELYS